MFDFDASKFLIVGVIALIFIPPKDLPRVLRQVGQFVGKMRRMATDFQGQFMDAMREADMADLRREAQKLAESAKVDVGLDSVTDLKSHLTGAIEGQPLMLDTAQAPSETVAEPPVEHDGSIERHLPDGQEGLADPNPDLRRLVGLDAAPTTPEPAPSPTEDHPVVSHSA